MFPKGSETEYIFRKLFALIIVLTVSLGFVFELSNFTNNESIISVDCSVRASILGLLTLGGGSSIYTKKIINF